MLYKVQVGRDVYLGTAEEVVAWMSRAEGAPGGGAQAYMRGVAARVAAQGRAARVDVSSPTAFLDSLARAGLLRVEERGEASHERVDPDEALGEGPVAFGEDVDAEDLRRDVFGSDDDREG